MFVCPGYSLKGQAKRAGAVAIEWLLPRQVPEMYFLQRFAKGHPGDVISAQVLSEDWEASWAIWPKSLTIA